MKRTFIITAMYNGVCLGSLTYDPNKGWDTEDVRPGTAIDSPQAAFETALAQFKDPHFRSNIPLDEIDFWVSWDFERAPWLYKLRDGIKLRLSSTGLTSYSTVL